MYVKYFNILTFSKDFLFMSYMNRSSVELTCTKCSIAIVPTVASTSVRTISIVTFSIRIANIGFIYTFIIVKGIIFYDVFHCLSIYVKYFNILTLSKSFVDIFELYE